jgi:hypothetical protein
MHIIHNRQSYQYNVPGDGSCLFWSVALAYLIDVKNYDTLFQQRYEILFGNEEEVHNARPLIQKFIQEYNPSLGVINNEKLQYLVREVFRNRIVDYMEANEDLGFFEALTDEERKDYISNMRKPVYWGDQHIVRVMCYMLNACITVKNVTKQYQVKHQRDYIQINLFYVDQCHYNFGLEDYKENSKDINYKVRNKDRNNFTAISLFCAVTSVALYSGAFLSEKINSINWIKNTFAIFASLTCAGFLISAIFACSPNTYISGSSVDNEQSRALSLI